MLFWPDIEAPFWMRWNGESSRCSDLPPISDAPTPLLSVASSSAMEDDRGFEKEDSLLLGLLKCP